MSDSQRTNPLGRSMPTSIQMSMQMPMAMAMPWPGRGAFGWKETD